MKGEWKASMRIVGPGKLRRMNSREFEKTEIADTFSYVCNWCAL